MRDEKAEFLVATRKGLFTWARGPSGWNIVERAFLADNVTFALRDPRDGATYAALNHGHFGVKLHRRDVGGEWREILAPAYPPLPEGEVDLDVWGKPLPWKLQLAWTLAPGHASQPGRVWCGTIPGALFRSYDRGESWQIVDSLWRHPDRKKWFGGGMDLPGIHSICVDPRDGQRVAVAVSCGGVWLTTDDGATWENRAHGMFAEYMPPEQRGDVNIQDSHCTVQCPGRPECYWTQHHNGIFRCVDDLQSWTHVPSEQVSTFGFAAAVHPTDANTAWFVPAIKDEKRIPVDARLIVTRTRDGGQSFESLTRGLPQQDAYDIVFRHALAVDPSGNRLAFGSTTGSLWVSENQGDDWHCLSNHLPPIYAVRWS